MNTKSTILLVLLLLSLGYNYYLYERCENNLMIPDKGACDNTDRFSKNEIVGADEVSLSDAKTMVEEYQTANPSDVNGIPPTGYVLSKHVFDSIFVDMDYNSVSLDFVTYQDKKTLVVKGMKTDSTKIAGAPTPDHVYIVQSFCPKNCSSW